MKDWVRFGWVCSQQERRPNSRSVGLLVASHHVFVKGMGSKKNKKKTHRQTASAPLSAACLPLLCFALLCFAFLCCVCLDATQCALKPGAGALKKASNRRSVQPHPPRLQSTNQSITQSTSLLLSSCVRWLPLCTLPSLSPPPPLSFYSTPSLLTGSRLPRCRSTARGPGPAP